jgi:small subunit ribosomal protein S16
MAVKIKLKRLGKIRTPQYRIVIADARTKREGRAIEEIGLYHPKEEPSLIQVDSARVQHWLSVGAQPTEPVLAILKITGDWQKHKGLPGAEGTLRFAPPKADHEAFFQAALAAAHADVATGDATTTRRPRKIAPGAVAEGTVAETAPAADAATDTPTETPTDTTQVAGGTGEDAPADTNPVESAAVEAVAEDTTTSAGDLPEAAVAADASPSHDAGH